MGTLRFAHPTGSGSNYLTIPTMIVTVSTLATRIMAALISSMITTLTAILVPPSAVVMASVGVNKATAQTDYHQACD